MISSVINFLLVAHLMVKDYAFQILLSVLNIQELNNNVNNLSLLRVNVLRMQIVHRFNVKINKFQSIRIFKKNNNFANK